MKIKNYYKILGIDSSTTSEEVHQAYKRLVRKYHPDLHQDNEKMAKVFAEVKEAYEGLGNLGKRLKYNLFLNKSKKLMDEISHREYKVSKKKF